MKVSVIVPVYNVEEYIDECMESIVAQTYRDIEVILIDDGSTDNSGEKCDNWGKKDKRVIVYHKKNEGLGNTRNFGLSKANGKYVMFVDSDDYITGDCVDNLMNPILEAGADFSISGFTRVDNKGKVIFREVYNSEIYRGESVKNILLPKFIGSLPDRRDSIFTTACAKIYDMGIIKKNNLMFHDEKEFMSEDLRFQFDYCSYSTNAHVVAGAVYYYRCAKNSITTSYNCNRFEKTLDVYNKVSSLIEKLKLPKDAFLRAKKMLFVQLRACFKQEKNNPNGFKASRAMIKKMVTNNEIASAVSSYPIKKLTFKQKIFIDLIKNRNTTILLFMVKFGII